MVVTAHAPSRGISFLLLLPPPDHFGEWTSGFLGKLENRSGPSSLHRAWVLRVWGCKGGSGDGGGELMDVNHLVGIQLSPLALPGVSELQLPDLKA